MVILKNNILRITVLIILSVFLAVPLISKSEESSSDKELAAIKNQFGAVLKLKGNSAKEINVIANLLESGSGMFGDSGMGVRNLTHASGEFCMLEPKTGRYMVHFSESPENTTEDILYFISPETFKQNGLQVDKLPPLPTQLGKMKPLQWYYYSGRTLEPHHGGPIGREFLVMAIDVK